MKGDKLSTSSSAFVSMSYITIHESSLTSLNSHE